MPAISILLASVCAAPPCLTGRSCGLRTHFRPDHPRSDSMDVIGVHGRHQVIQEEPQGPQPGRARALAVAIVAVVGVVIAVLGHPVPSLAAAVVTTALSRLILGLPPSADLPLELMTRAFGSVAGLKKPRHQIDDNKQGQQDLPPDAVGEGSPLPNDGAAGDQDR
jgi:hypothetical protein